MPPTSIGSWALLIHRAVAHRGLDADALFVEAGVDPATLWVPSTRYPYEVLQRLWTLGTEATGDPDFGVWAARCFQPANWHALGYTWLASPTLRAAFQQVVTYGRVVSDAATFEFSPSDAGGWFIIRPGLLEPPPTRAAIDAAIGTVVRMCRWIVGERFRPLRVRVVYDEPASVAALSEFFGAPIEFGFDVGAIEVAAADLDLELPTKNAQLAHACEQVMLEYLACFDPTTIAVRVSIELTSQLATGRMTEATVADALGMTERTLQRRLREEGTSYRQLLDSVRRELAMKYLSEAELAISEVTYLLGFSEPSNFSRAFKRWTGRSPTAYRRALPRE